MCPAERRGACKRLRPSDPPRCLDGKIFARQRISDNLIDFGAIQFPALDERISKHRQGKTMLVDQCSRLSARIGSCDGSFLWRFD